jgi:hypothetical protein
MRSQMGSKSAERASKKWTTEAAGLPCTIELTDDRCWVVTIASASTSRREDLSLAIIEASGGLVSNTEALELAAALRGSETT